MEEIEKLQGEAIVRLFQELQQDKTPLQMQLVSGDYNCLTYIVDIRKWKRTPQFIVQASEGFQKATLDIKCWRLRFEFNDKDNIKCVFTTSRGKFTRGMLWITIPEIVHRYQRRRLFRLEAPYGTKLFFKVNNTHYKLLVKNVSLGGTLGVLGSLTKTMAQELRGHQPKMLKNVELVFLDKNDKDLALKVNINQSRIKRTTRNPLTNKHEFAIEFTEITETEHEKLTEIFYQWQRDYLRKRRLLQI